MNSKRKWKAIDRSVISRKGNDPAVAIRTRFHQALALLVAILLIGYPLPSNATGMMGVAKVSGKAERNGLPLPNGSVVSSGDFISTQSKSALQLSLNRQERIWLGPDTSARLSKDAGNLVIALDRGSVGFESPGHVRVTFSGHDVAVSSRPSSPVQAQLVFRDRQQAQVWLQKGSLEIDQAGKSVVLHATRSGLIAYTGAGSSITQPESYAASAQATSNNGTVKGTVVNATLYIVPNASVKLVSSTGFTYTTTTNASGAFQFNNVPPGTYTLSVSQPNYPPYEMQNVVVRGGQVTSVYVELKGTSPKTGMKNKGLIIGIVAGAGAALGIGLGVGLSGGNKSTVSPSTVP